VVLAVGAKRDPLSVWRPARCVVFAEQLLELLCLFFAVDRRDPEMLLRRPDDILPVRRNLQILALLLVAPDIAKQTRLAPGHICGPCLLPGHFCQALRICRGALLTSLPRANTTVLPSGVSRTLAIGCPSSPA